MSGNAEKALKARMKARLDESSWTLARLAEATGENYKNIQRWVTGDTTVPAEFLVRFATVLPTDPAWLLLGRSEEKPTPQSEERASAMPIGDSERLDLLEMLSDVQRAIAGGRTPPPPSGRKPDRDADELERMLREEGEAVRARKETGTEG